MHSRRWLGLSLVGALAAPSAQAAREPATRSRQVLQFASKSTSQEESPAAAEAPAPPSPAPKPRAPRTDWGKRPSGRSNSDVVDTPMLEPLPLPRVIATLRQRTLTQPRDPVGWYLLGRALLLSTSTGQLYASVVVQQLPYPSFSADLEAADADILTQAHVALTQALRFASSPLKERVALSLGWTEELQARLPDGDPELVVTAIGRYLTVAEGMSPSYRHDSAIFQEAMAEAQVAFGTLSMWKRYWADDLKQRMAKLGEYPATPLAPRYPHRVIDSPLLIPLAGLDDFADDQAAVAFPLDPYAKEKRWSWVTPRAALLVWDPAGTGDVRSGAQLFGFHTWAMAPPDGFAALSMLDANLDGWVSGAELSGLRLWVDRDGDGVPAKDEVFDLQTFGVTGLATIATGALGRHTVNGAGVRLATGGTLPLVDWFAQER